MITENSPEDEEFLKQLAIEAFGAGISEGTFTLSPKSMKKVAAALTIVGDAMGTVALSLTQEERHVLLHQVIELVDALRKEIGS